MARLLWGIEIQALVGQATNRDDGLAPIGERFLLDDLRRCVIAAVCGRVMNRWEQALWTRFDAERRSIPPLECLRPICVR